MEFKVGDLVKYKDSPNDIIVKPNNAVLGVVYKIATETIFENSVIGKIVVTRHRLLIKWNNTKKNDGFVDSF